VKNSFLLLTIIGFFLASPAFAMEEWQDSTPEEIEEMYARAMQLKPVEFQDVEFGVGKKFFRTEKAFIKCLEASCNKDAGFSSRTFGIYANELKVGEISALYRAREKELEIANMKVFSDYRSKGYGEDALMTVLSVYRSTTRSYLEFDSFVLSVFKDEASAPARGLYKKLGFEIMMEQPSCYKMSLKR
jgi:ribosomal protein S18 acetylase RimI-like enzyme